VNNNFCYIHIPFCTSKCKYCRFASFWNLGSKKVDLYIDFLLKEIKTNNIDFKNLKSIYFGWWTPSILSIKQLNNIIYTLRNKYQFDNKIEITLEATPITITKENLIWWKNIWINRLSIWIQTLNNESLVEIWRENNKYVIMALDNLKEIWFYNLSVDFIIWLPFVKKWELKKDIEFILEKYNFIKHISVYMLEEYYYPCNWDSLSIWEEEYLDEFIEINNFLKNKWFNRYEISNYTLPWYECKHNKAYWNHSNMLAFWLWAHWFVNNIRYSNSENFIDYYLWKQKIEDKQTFNDLFLEKVMFQLRTDWLTKNIYEKLNLNKIEYLIQEEYLKKKSDKIILSDKWVLVLDYILGEII
jgi:oxygen-independent coproporphyrinogen-3 oxidase